MSRDKKDQFLNNMKFCDTRKLSDIYLEKYLNAMKNYNFSEARYWRSKMSIEKSKEMDFSWKHIFG